METISKREYRRVRCAELVYEANHGDEQAAGKLRSLAREMLTELPRVELVKVSKKLLKEYCNG